METQFWAISLVVIGDLIGALGPIYFKKATNLINIKQLSSIYKNKYLFLGLLIYAFGTLVFILALKGGELSVLYSFIGLSYVWVCFYSKFLLKEKMNRLKWIGIIIIVAGVSLIGLGA